MFAIQVDFQLLRVTVGRRIDRFADIAHNPCDMLPVAFADDPLVVVDI